MNSWKSSSLFDLKRRIFGLVDNMVAGGVPIWSVAPIWSESWMGGCHQQCACQHSKCDSRLPTQRESGTHTRGIAKAVSGREKWKCFRLIVSHLECIFEAEGTGTKQPVCYVTEMAPPFNKAMIISSFISGL